MKLVDPSTTTKTKYSILLKINNEYPAPGKYVMVFPNMLDGIIAKANIILANNETFLQSAITTSSKDNLDKGTIFAPCIEEDDFNGDFPIVLKVEEINTDNGVTVITNSPFTNLPDEVKMEFNADELNVVELFFGPDTPIIDGANIDEDNSVSYITKKGKHVSYEILGKMPTDLSEWVYSNCVKAFSRVYDFTDELSKLTKTTTINEIDDKLPKVVDYKKLSKNNSIESKNNDYIAQNSVDGVTDLHELLEAHPLYDYTCDMTSTMFLAIEDECGVQLAEDKLNKIMEIMLTKMIKADIYVSPDSSND